MDLEKIMEALAALGSDVAAHIAKVDAKCDAVTAAMAEMKKTKADEAGDRDNGIDNTMAVRTAADSATRNDLEVLRSQVNQMAQRMPTRTPVDRNALADYQSKADSTYRSLGEGGAPPPMSGESVLDYAIRLHRPLMKHSKRFKDAELHMLARDPSTLNAVLDSVRADAYEVGLSPVGMPEFQHREITTMLPTGHKQTTWVGNGTIFKQLSRPVRHVKSIGADDRYPRSMGGSVYAPTA